VAFSATAGEVHVMTSHVEHMATETTLVRLITGSEATLMTSPQGATMMMSTSELTPGHVTTAWWVIMTKPMLCEAKPCSPKDVIGRAGIVGTQIVYADGVVNNPDGTATFAAHLPSGPVKSGWYDQNFQNPTEAEIHLVLNDHGPLVPEITASMLTSYRGGCRDDSLPPPFPNTAKTDGTPGPNGCLLIQDSIFIQDHPHPTN
jgi:hypothetical protein